MRLAQPITPFGRVAKSTAAPHKMRGSYQYFEATITGDVGILLTDLHLCLAKMSSAHETASV